MTQTLSVLDFAYWRKWVEDNSLQSPVRPEPLRDSYVYLCTRITAPSPCGSTIKRWNWFDTLDEAYGYLRHVWMPYAFSIWLVRDEWDENEELPLPAEDVFAQCQELSPDNRHADAIPRFEAVLGDLDAAINRPETAKRFADFQAVSRRFNQEWGRTPTWEFEFNIHEGLESAVNQLIGEKRNDYALEDDDALEESEKQTVLALQDAVKSLSASVDSVEASRLIVAQFDASESC